MNAIVGERSAEAAVEIRDSARGADPAIRYRNQAIVLLQEGRLAESERYSHEALDFVRTTSTLSMCWGWPSGARALGRRRGDLRPRSRDRAERLQIFDQSGARTYSLGRLEEAGDTLCKALELEPDTFDAVMNLGLVRSDQGEFDLAAQLLERRFAASRISRCLAEYQREPEPAGALGSRPSVPGSGREAEPAASGSTPKSRLHVALLRGLRARLARARVAAQVRAIRGTSHQSHILEWRCLSGPGHASAC